MLFYLLHKTSIWDSPSISNGQRNIRILFVVLVCYLIIHSVTFECKDSLLVCKIIYNYFWWIIAGDILLSACEYRMFYGRSITNELKTHETDIYDEASHKYIKGPAETPKLTKVEVPDKTPPSQDI
jgi:hypothetical protein